MSQHQVIPSSVLIEFSDFIHTFDRVTAREARQAAALREAPAILQLIIRRPEVCFFTAWDFHLPPEKRVAAPVNSPASNQHIGDLVEQEARAFFGECPDDLLQIVDDAESLQRGKFHGELQPLRDLLHQRGWRAELGHPTEMCWDGQRLLFNARLISSGAVQNGTASAIARAA